jgi:hypothetical protein
MASNATPLVDALRQARLRRNSLAGALRSAQMEMERGAAGASPDPRAKHERQALADALAALLSPAPEPRRLGVEAELDRMVRDLKHEEQRQPLEAALGWER